VLLTHDNDSGRVSTSSFYQTAELKITDNPERPAILNPDSPSEFVGRDL
jgi:hypothetical protein